MKDQLKVVLISGSSRHPSHTASLVQAVSTGLSERGAHTCVWILSERRLPASDPSYHSDPILNPDPVVRELVREVADSDAIVLASPVYHNSYSGILKNALDHLAISQFYRKPVGLVGHGGNRTTQAVDHLRIVVRGLLGFALSSQVCTCNDDYAETAEVYRIISSDIEARIERFIDEMMLVAAMMSILRTNT